MKPKTVFYVMTCIVSTILCFANNLPYYLMGFSGYKKFWVDTFTNGAASSITVDLAFVTILVFAWMYVEAKKQILSQQLAEAMSS